MKQTCVCLDTTLLILLKIQTSTCLLFICSETGSEILVSYCTDYVYLFSTNDERKALSITRGHGNASRHRGSGVNSEDTARNLPPVKRLRLRGDWSDTGPNARPENEQDQEENNTSKISRLLIGNEAIWQIVGVAFQSNCQRILPQIPRPGRLEKACFILE